MSTITNADLPNPGAPIVGPDGRLSPEWFGFLLALFNRTGGKGNPIDIATLQKLVVSQGAEIDELFRLDAGQVAAPLVGALLQRVIALEMAAQGVVPMRAVATQTLPDAIPVSRIAQSLPDPVPVRAKDATTDIYKLISR